MAYSNLVTIQGVTDGGNVTSSVAVDGENHQVVNIQRPRSAFGEILTAVPSPVVQLTFQYNLLMPLLVSTATTGSGTVTCSGGLAACSTAGVASSSGVLTSKRIMVYHPGQGCQARFTGMFTTGAANTTQICGVGGSACALGFGYNGTVFGILYRTGSVDTWIPQTTFTADRLDGSNGSLNKSGITLVPTNLNVFQIEYGYLGAGAIQFFVQSQYDGEWIMIHQIGYPNSYTTPSLSQPSMPFYMAATSTTGTTNVTVKTASAGLFVDGDVEYLGSRYGANNNKSAVTTEVSILTLKCAATLNSVSVQGQMRIRSLSANAVNAGAAGNCVLFLVKNATLGGTPSYTNIDATNSIASYDIAGTTVTGGNTVWNGAFSSNSSGITQIMTDEDLFVGPGDTMTFAVSSTVSTAVTVTVNWSEDI